MSVWSITDVLQVKKKKKNSTLVWNNNNGNFYFWVKSLQQKRKRERKQEKVRHVGISHTCGNGRVHGGSLPGVDLLPGEAISPQRHAVATITVVLFKRTAAYRTHTRGKMAYVNMIKPRSAIITSSSLKTRFSTALSFMLAGS